MRLFVAMELPDEVRQRLSSRLNRVRHRLPPARWVPPENLHLTLSFLGEVSESVVADLRAVLEGLFAAYDVIDLDLCGAGTFPAGRPARVAWVGIEGGDRLLQLQSEVCEATARALGRDEERHGFHPHVTVARPRRPWPRAAVEMYLVAGEGLSETWPVPRAVLVESRLGPGGVEYSIAGDFPLAS